LFHLVKDALLASASTSFRSCVISVSSAAHRYGTINLNDLNFENTEYNAHTAYGNSKLANIHFANELDRKFQSQNLRAFSVHPGGIITPLARYLPGTDNLLEDPVISKIMKSPAQGAAAIVWAAVASELEGKGGLYLDECAESEPTPPSAPYYWSGYGAQAFDLPTEKKLWSKSLELVGLRKE
jgi:NAD(P)-dependent dehydrogenase (short-subunit alcohol dehydrogenase family)